MSEEGGFGRAFGQDFGVQPSNSEALERGGRLREAVRLGGGAAEISRRTGIPDSTLGGYMAGREMKFGNAVALAEATGVRLDWLATGAGPMREGDAPAVAPADPEKPAERPLFGMVKVDRLVQALRGAQASSGGDERLFAHLVVVLYDQLTEAERARAPEDFPQRHPQKDPQL